MPASRQNRQRNGNWIIADSGNIFYRADSAVDRSAAAASPSPRFPTPLIGPRRTRPHAIHIVAYPPGYVPRELRPKPRSQTQSLKARTNKRAAKLRRIVPVAVAATANGSGDSVTATANGRSLSSSSAATSRTTSTGTGAAGTGILDPPPYDDVGPAPANQNPVNQPPRPQRLSHQPQQPSFDSITTTSSSSNSTTMAATTRARRPSSAYHLASNRNSIMSVRSAKSAVSSLVTEVPKPVASGSGVSCSILLAEPNIFLSGFDHDSHVQCEGQSGTALLRGRLQVNASKNVKIKAIQLKLLGRARTEWPEGVPPFKQDVFEEESLRTQVLTFFNAMNDGWETEYGNQCTYQLKTGSANTSTTNLTALPPRVGSLVPSVSQRSGPTAKELKRLSLQSAQSRSFGKGDYGVATTTQAKGFKVFYPGTYDYSFELPIDHHQLETTKLQYGSVRWELHATVDRAGAFKPNLHGMKEVSIVRLPDQMSLETTEPISISRQWEDQLHYDIIISGKSFPIGSKIPIAFKLTPLAKVQVHKFKVYVTESIEYWTNDKRVTRKDPGRKILLLEKAAGKPLDSTWASSEVNTVHGGEPSARERREAREIAQRRRNIEGSRAHRSPAPLPEPTANLLGDLDLGLESLWGSTEIEANVQIPTCEMMAKNKDLRLHPDCSWKNVNVYHWIKIVMRISRLDPEDPSGTKRRHFEISIDSPFTVLNCRATQANTNLPAYSGPTSHPTPYQSTCGCPDATSVAADISPNSSTGTLTGADMVNDMLPTPPQAAHLHDSAMNPASEQSPTGASVHGSGIQGEPRPIHLMRAPSFNPPAFDDDIAPPPAIVVENTDATEARVVTPPPQYDAVVGTPSVDGLADYFARLADYGYNDDEDSGSDSEDHLPRILDRTGRVNVSHPRMPGGRMPSRSMEISRPPLSLNLDSLPTRGNGATMPGAAI
ncbi:Putative arrestin-related trafficking adapter C2D10.04 [Tolypocladium paradoxum]|uniref:Arrestin-related trafficking adapter C2D10.04 n=1 Tax=Tolypocladium paradoxum TaxID=94208 RepID=A0A2S4KTA6_9HYPO|nr:Putative arrestin-related trafficking adapter C2D10.04 [Tolypocladium paradoxum]